MNRVRKFAQKLQVIWNEDILHWIGDWFFWKFKYPKYYKDKRCLRCGHPLDSDYCNDCICHTLI